MLESLLPVNLSASVLDEAAGRPEQGRGRAKGASKSTLKIPTASQLGDWQQESYQLSSDLAVKLGFPIGSGDAAEKMRILLFGTSRFKDVQVDGHTHRYGVAIRVLVEISSTEATVKLSPPTIAAQVELGIVQATSQLLVTGYTGDISDEMPDWQSFDVNAYADFMNSVNAVKAKVFKDAAHIKPELLSSTLAPQLKLEHHKAGRIPWFWIGI